MTQSWIRLLFSMLAGDQCSMVHLWSRASWWIRVQREQWQQQQVLSNRWGVPCASCCSSGKRKQFDVAASECVCSCGADKRSSGACNTISDNDRFGVQSAVSLSRPRCAPLSSSSPFSSLEVTAETFSFRFLLTSGELCSMGTFPEDRVRVGEPC